jgi:hypothetical protein
MRRSISYCEPSHVRAGDVGTWKFIHTTAQSLPKGTKLRFDLQSSGREIDWQIPEIASKKGENTIFLQMDDGTTAVPKQVEVPTSFLPLYEFTLPKAVATGESFAIIVGTSDLKLRDKGGGNRVQTNSQRRRAFSLYIDPTGKQRFGEPEIFNLDVLGSDLSTVKILTPSMVGKNKRFDITVRFEDKFGNLTSETDEDTLIELSYEGLRENLNWRLFVPETGFIILPNLYFNEKGVFTIQLRNLKNKKVYRSSPIRCTDETDRLLMWGLLHGESEKIDSTENIDSCLRHFRDERALNFFAISPFEDSEETSNELWKNLLQSTQEFDEEDRFTTFVGFQRVGDAGTEGVRHILYLKDQKQLIRKKDAKGSTLERLYKAFSPKEMISIPSFSMAKGYSFNFKAFDPDFERVVEIYNAWGSSERTEKNGNPYPIQSGKGKSGISSDSEGAVIEALNKNCRFGFVAGGLDDRGIFAPLFDADQVQYHPGLTAVITTAHSKNAIGEALYNRSCYATTGERIVVEFSIASAKMGQELSVDDKPGLAVNRHIRGFVAGTKELDRIEIVRNGQVIETLHSSDYFLEFTYDDMTPIAASALPAKGGKPNFVYYFLRAFQKDGHMAWSSPIWVDLATGNGPTKKKTDPKKAEKVIPKPQPIVIDDEDDLDEDEEEDLE